ncbi:MAG: translation initiation factor IF-2 [Candidatus Pacebacteria bacterium]|nr:translation initiation factor IF-2 [Candidatus Paceibacterota bacterium]
MSKPHASRPPVVVIMGHIDHGKSTLLDYIRKTNIVAGEAGGITQHLGAYEVEHSTAEGKKGKITFLDTPGHEAFGGIRARGAKVADIAILVVAGDDGVKPQTLEALKCIRDAGLPFIVAVNKIDKPGSNVERTKQNLAEHEVYIEGYGGDVPAVPISALQGQGIPELLDMIILVSELQELKGDHALPGTGVVIENRLDTKKGMSATLIIKDGTVKSGAFVVAEDAYSPVRIFESTAGVSIKEATFSTPVKIIGWNKLPPVGAEFTTVEDKRDAEELTRTYALAAKKIAKIEESFENKAIIPIIIKADAMGSLEGILHELKKITHDKVGIKIVDQGIGDISESDIKRAQSFADTILIAFHVKPDAKAKALLERNPLNYKEYSIIYELVEFLRQTLTSKIPKEYIEETTGRAKILAVFSKNKDKQIVGGKVQEGSILLGSEVKIIRRDTEIGVGKIRELQQQKVKAQEVREGYEFGMMIESKIEIAAGDKLECVRVVEKVA